MGNEVVSCRFEGCGRSARTAGLCASHYMQQWSGRELTPLRPKLPQRPQGLSLEETVFWFLRQGTFSRGCILLDTKAKHGAYPTVQWQGRKTTLGHLVLEWKTGQQGDGRRMVMLHSCDRSLCINPDHLRWGSMRENAMDCVARGRHWQANRRAA